ncbi:MAG: methylated-DNA--[protein]-cysteine S-methyltransferase [Raoultibacter sp.]
MASCNSTYFTYNSPVGRITIASDGTSITTLAFGEVALEGIRKATDITNRAANQLQEYFAGKRTAFDLPLNPTGTDFQKQVWAALCRIPYGSTCSYSDIAAAIGNPKACRAVGGANNKNPIPIIIPCHRVIGANGKPVGYAGTLKTKLFLLNLEHR